MSALEEQLEKYPQYKNMWIPYIASYLSTSNYDYEIEPRSDGTHAVTIRYENITIKNSESKSHKIPELYVKFHVGPTNIYSIQGAKLKYTREEYESGYKHSHLSSGTSIGYGNFCTGHGEINDFNGGGSNIYLPSELNAELFFNVLDGYVEWESIEGGPHIRMSTIRKSGKTISNTEIKLPEKLPIKSDYIDFKVVNGEIDVNIKWAKEQLEPNCYELNGSYYALDADMNAESSWGRNIEKGSTGSIRFKGENHRLKIVSNEETKTKEYEKSVHPTTLQEYRIRIAKLLKQFIIQNDYTFGQVHNDSTKESVGSNDVSV